MARFCANCGKAIEDGVELCPDCGGPVTEDGAALFTRMTAETEVWQTPAEKKERPKPTRSQKQLLGYIAAAIAVVVAAVCLILYIQPVNRVVRAIRDGNYDRAMETYWGNTALASGRDDAPIQRAAKSAAERVVDAFARHELSADEAAGALGKLGTLGKDAEALLAEEIEAFRILNLSQEHFAAAEQLSLNGEYLAAREEYLLVSENDSSYAEAQEQAAESLDRYADSVLSEADVYIQSKDYAAAIQEMENARKTLLGFDVYNEKLEYKLDGSYGLYEKAVLDSAAELAAKQEYTAAAGVLAAAMERFDYRTDALEAARANYLDLAQDKAAADAVAEADALYEQGLYAEAFALLDTVRETPDVAAEEEIKNAVAALERRFAADQIAAAEAAFGKNRTKLPDAVTGLRAALRVRELEAIQEYLDEISAWLPVSLAKLEYVDKQGVIFRSASPFEGLDGVNYDAGWVWGEDGAELTFVLNGNYDLLKGTVAVRRDDQKKAGGQLIILCDGEAVYESETLTHPTEESIEVSVDISGCQRLTLRFVNDYSVRTTDNGYCYHGFCTPTITKYLEGEEQQPEEAEEEPDDA